MYRLTFLAIMSPAITGYQAMRQIAIGTLLLILLSAACSNVPDNNAPTSNANTGKQEGQSTRSASKHEFMKLEAGRSFLYDPTNDTYMPVRDVRQQMSDLSGRYKPTQKEQQEFLDHRTTLMNEVRGFNNSARPDNSNPPVPGGVGIGILFRTGELIFNEATAAYYYILAPTALGGNLSSHPDDHFYLTSTNRAGKGCEAYVAYKGQQKASFNVFDWALVGVQDPFVISMPYDSWGDYKITYNINGQDFQALYVVNSTRFMGGVTWLNEVYLHNASTGTRDLIWSYSFPWSPRDQNEKNEHWWGPILETFLPDYGDTNQVGFASALVVQDGYEYTLTDSNTYVSNDGSDHGFQLDYLTPNYNLIAH